ncbi:MAG: hypothetical protein CMG74_09645 [Candidatus Marinimicrobia bacterium]|nr:hypothetical protein [Candidatus Neomarinimicrobiota bacterium]|tara:strand:+ start:5198 stop:6553 length:1356 start_codon:yes stop_codon:yes gene_type:complete
MIRLIIFFILFSILILNCEDQIIVDDRLCGVTDDNNTFESNTERFFKTYGDKNNNSGNYVIELDDGGYIIGGSTYNYDQGNNYYWIMKTNAYGDSLWEKTADDFGAFNSSMEPISDGGYLVYGTTEDSNDDWDIIVSKIGPEGNNEWIKTFGRNSDSEGAYIARETRDGGYIVGGYADDYEQINTYPYSALYVDVYIIKLSSNGNTEWKKKIRDNDFGYVYDIIEDHDGNFMIAGYTRFAKGTWLQNDGYLLKLDHDGNKLWSRWYASEELSDDLDTDDKFTAFNKTFDGGYILVGETNRLGWMLKTDLDGNPEWEYFHNGGGGDNNLSFNSVEQCFDGGYVVTCSRYNTRYGLYDDKWNDSDGLLIKVNGQGSLQWERTFGVYATDTTAFNPGWGIGQDHIRSVKETKDYGFIITGSTNSFDVEPFSLGYAFDVWLIKTDSEGITISFND